MTRPELKADTRQQAEMRAELHNAIDRIADHYPNIAAEADNRGWPANLRQDDTRRGGSELTSVEAAAEHSLFTKRRGQPDHTEWLASFAEMRAHIRTVAARATILDPPKATRTGRENTVELCSLCKEPITEISQQGNPAIRRIDQLPYHGKTCYFRVRRAR